MTPLPWYQILSDFSHYWEEKPNTQSERRKSLFSLQFVDVSVWNLPAPRQDGFPEEQFVNQKVAKQTRTLIGFAPMVLFILCLGY